MREIRSSGSVEGVMSNRDSYSDFLWVCPLNAVHACPTGVPSRPTPSATGQNLRKGTQTCFGAGVRTSREARSGFWEGERASEGRGCLERGTLNADRKANRKGAALFNSLPHGASSESQLRN